MNIYMIITELYRLNFFKNDRRLKYYGEKAFEMHGYSDKEIAKYEHELQISFPSAFRDYLAKIGKSGFIPFISYSFELEKLKTNLEWFTIRMNSNRRVFSDELNRPLCVFLYDFAGGYKYFFCDESENPEVYCSDEKEIKYSTNHQFLEYLMFEVKQLDQ
jgi:hypothetical protein